MFRHVLGQNLLFNLTHKVTFSFVTGGFLFRGSRILRTKRNTTEAFYVKNSFKKKPLGKLKCLKTSNISV